MTVVYPRPRWQETGDQWLRQPDGRVCKGALEQAGRGGVEARPRAGREGVIVRRASARTTASTDLRFGSTVPADPLSIAYVRHAMQSFSEVCGGEKAADLALVFTELVTNSIRHARLRRTDIIEVRLTLGRDGLSGAVVDTGPGFDPGRFGPLPARGGGFGLFIVERLTKSWGVDLAGGRTTVWFEM